MQNKFLFLVIIFLSFNATNLLAQRTIRFSGINWYVRNDPGEPGPNQWSDTENNAWVDSSGYLHLKITKVGNTWYCSEVYTDKSYGYAKYTFQLANNAEKYDQNIVVGLFTYENDSREIDIEFSRWGDPNSMAGWYTIQPPPYTSANEKSFALNMTDNYSTHIIDWSKDSINLQSYHGNFNGEPSVDSLIQQWTYIGSKNPPAGAERLHINFWLLEGLAPVNQKEAELIIKSVTISQATDVKGLLNNTLPKQYELEQNYPNPFNPETKIKYSITTSPSFPLHTKERDLRVRLKVYDILCEEIATLVNEEKPAGNYQVEFNGTGLPSGIYFYQLTAGGFTQTKKMILLL